MTQLNWRGCAQCESPVPADSGDSCLVCGSKTGQLWSAEQAAGHCKVGAQTWRTYGYENRIPRSIGYHPALGVVVWDDRAVIAWLADGRPAQSGPRGRRK